MGKMQKSLIDRADCTCNYHWTSYI